MIEKIREAVEWLDGATFENRAGQIIDRDRSGVETVICGLSCGYCSEIDDAGDYGDILVTLLNTAMHLPDLIAACELVDAYFSGSVLGTQEEAIVTRVRSVLGKMR